MLQGKLDVGHAQSQQDAHCIATLKRQLAESRAQTHQDADCIAALRTRLADGHAQRQQRADGIAALRTQLSSASQISAVQLEQLPQNQVQLDIVNLELKHSRTDLQALQAPTDSSIAQLRQQLTVSRREADKHLFALQQQNASLTEKQHQHGLNRGQLHIRSYEQFSTPPQKFTTASSSSNSLLLANHSQGIAAGLQSTNKVVIDKVKPPKQPLQQLYCGATSSFSASWQRLQTAQDSSSSSNANTFGLMQRLQTAQDSPSGNSVRTVALMQRLQTAQDSPSNDNAKTVAHMACTADFS